MKEGGSSPRRKEAVSISTTVSRTVCSLARLYMCVYVYVCMCVAGMYACSFRYSCWDWDAKG